MDNIFIDQSYTLVLSFPYLVLENSVISCLNNIPYLDSTLRFAIFKFPSARPLPYPIPWKQFFIVGNYSAPLMVAFLYQLFAFYLLPIILVVFSGLSIRNMLKHNKERDFIIAASLLIIALIMILMVRVRPSGPRIMTSALFCAIACSIMMSNKNRAIRIVSMSTLIMTVLAFVPFAFYSVRAQQSFFTEAVNDRCGVLASKGYAQFLSVTASKIRELTLPSEKILCGNPSLYFLSDRSSVTSYYEPHPCMTDTQEIQQAIIKDIEKNRMRYFIRSKEWGWDSYFTIEPAHEPKILDEYIETHYSIIYDYYLFQIYERKEK